MATSSAATWLLRNEVNDADANEERSKTCYFNHHVELSWAALPHRNELHSKKKQKKHSSSFLPCRVRLSRRIDSTGIKSERAPFMQT